MTTIEELHASHGDVTQLRPDVAKEELHELCLFLQDHGWAGVMCLREAVEAFGAPDADSLDAAGAEAKAALPKDDVHWAITGVVMRPWAGEQELWHADATPVGGSPVIGRGPTPAAALRALAAKLRKQER